jgi:GMP synthase-like glutamine amidotransferase
VRILVLEHEADAPAGLLADWARARGHELEVAPVRVLDAWPGVDEFHVVVTLGSEVSVTDASHSWIGAEVDFLAAAHARSVPLLGICFGGQILSKALGGEVHRAPRAEVRWREIDSDDPDLIPAGPWAFWHEDQFTLPPGARLIAGLEAEVVAFSSGASIGLQFHPEADGAIVQGWADSARDKLVSYGVDPREFERQIREQDPHARERAFDLFDRLAARWSAISLAEAPTLG